MTTRAAQQLGQVPEQRRVGAVECVDGLVRVADDEEVRLVAEESGQEAELRRVHILHLVDEEVPGPPAHAVGEPGVAGQGIGAGDDQVVEVEQPPPRPLRLVPGVGLRDLLGSDTTPPPVLPGLCFVVCRGDEPSLGPTDLSVERAGATGVARRRVGQQPPPIRQELREGPPSQLAVLTQQAERRSVEGSRLDTGHAQRPQPGAQFFCGLAAEGGDEGAIGIDRPVACPSGHPERQDPRLARPGARDDTKQSLVGLDGLALRRGQPAGTREGLPSVPVEGGGHTGRVPKGCAAGTMAVGRRPTSGYRRRRLPPGPAGTDG